MSTKTPMTREEQLQRAKIRAMGEGVRVWRIDEYTFVSPSLSLPGVAYLLNVLPDGDVTCHCAAALADRPCKHMGAVLIVLQLTQTANATREKAAALAQDLEDLYGK